MPVVVDGNNLLHAARSAEALSLLVGRSMLCDTLARWARRRSERVQVVFDGPAPPAALAKQIAKPAIQVTYSGAGTSADVVVTAVIEADSAASRLVVVSSDREIIRAAKRRRACPVRSEDFWSAVKRDLSRPEPAANEPEEKLKGIDPEEAQRWLDEFGLG